MRKKAEAARQALFNASQKDSFKFFALSEKAHSNGQYELSRLYFSGVQEAEKTSALCCSAAAYGDHSRIEEEAKTYRKKKREFNKKVEAFKEKGRVI